jgi:hypothetical protein
MHRQVRPLEAEYSRGRVGSTLLLLCVAAAACRPAPPRHERRSDATSGARPVQAAPVIREPTVVAFWLPASDTLKPGEGADLLDDFRSYTGLISPMLEEQGIKLETTTADSIVVDLENGPQRVIRLSGLDYPFGYVLVEPGYPETILTGVSTEDEVMEQVSWYFGLDEKSDSSDSAGTVRTWYRQVRPYSRDFLTRFPYL